MAKDARAAERQGRFADAIRLAGAILERNPAHREAASVAIDAHLASHDREGAMRAYERFAQAARSDDAALLAPIAKAELQALSSPSTFTAVSVSALEELARTGDPSSRASLVMAAKTEREAPRGRLALLALGRLGDLDALAELARMAEESHGQARIAVMQTLSKSSYSGVAALLRRGLADRDPMVRVAALEGMANLRRPEVRGDVQQALTDTVSIVRLSAAVALHRLGDASADEVLWQALRSDVVDVRLLAARAFVGGHDRSWVAAIEPVLTNPEGLNRVHAAGLLLRDRLARAAALKVLTKATVDENPVVRLEAARLLADDGEAPAAVLRPLLHDNDESVRLRAAARLLANAATSAPANSKRPR